jgi:glycosyltransferase involved in cell wall biosynthesis
LLEAWNDERFKNDRLHLCGRLYPEIKELLEKYNFKNVILPGFVDTKEYFKKCDVYVFPSLLEGSSKSVYEAMNMSLPCIVTPNSGSVIVDKEDGFIIDIASSDDIKNKMLRFKENPELISIMGKKAYENVQKYSWNNYAKKIINIYEKVSK